MASEAVLCELLLSPVVAVVLTSLVVLVLLVRSPVVSLLEVRLEMVAHPVVVLSRQSPSHLAELLVLLVEVPWNLL